MTARHTRRRIARSAGLLLALSFAPAAQGQVTPMSVNDCTLLPDPGALRRCLDQAEGRVVTLPPLNTATGLDQSKREVEATRPVTGPTIPDRVESNFLTGKATRPVAAPPKKKNVIDLD